MTSVKLQPILTLMVFTFPAKRGKKKRARKKYRRGKKKRARKKYRRAHKVTKFGKNLTFCPYSLS